MVLGVDLTAEDARKYEAVLFYLDEHVISSGDGKCVICRMEDPCPVRRLAYMWLSWQGLLPVRRPGATRPELIGFRHPEPGTRGFGWFAAATDTGSDGGDQAACPGG